MDKHDWDERYRDTELLWSKGPNQFVADELADLPPGRAVDLAAGEGRNAVWLAERGFAVTALDFSQVAIDKGRTIAEKRGVEVEWVAADLLEHPLPSRSFDLVVIAYLQLPWSQMQPILAKAADAVADKGTLFLIGHDARNLAEGYGGPKSAAVLYSPEAVAAELGELSIERVETVDRNVETDEGPRVALDCLVRASRR